MQRCPPEGSVAALRRTDDAVMGLTIQRELRSDIDGRCIDAQLVSDIEKFVCQDGDGRRVSVRVFDQRARKEKTRAAPNTDFRQVALRSPCCESENLSREAVIGCSARCTAC